MELVTFFQLEVLLWRTIINIILRHVEDINFHDNI